MTHKMETGDGERVGGVQHVGCGLIQRVAAAHAARPAVSPEIHEHDGVARRIEIGQHRLPIDVVAKPFVQHHAHRGTVADTTMAEPVVHRQLRRRPGR